MMKWVLTSVYIFSTISLTAQSIPDKEFVWFTNPAFTDSESNEEWFAKVEADPKILMPVQTSVEAQEQFRKGLLRILQSVNLATTDNGFIKIKLAFAHQSEDILIQKIGTKDLPDSNQRIINQLQPFFTQLKFTPGRQRQKEVNCIGIVYLKIERGILNSLRIVNFELTPN